MTQVIGLDFDNTLVNYDDLIYSIARERNLIRDDLARNKKDIRDSIRRLEGGEIEWQYVQGVVYGPKMHEAKPSNGAESFLSRCIVQGVRVYIVSHKTRLAGYDDTRTDLRVAALTWIEQQGWFSNTGLGLSRDSVYFESSRGEKVERIRRLNCTHFIDDLEETFLEEDFPNGVQKILYAPFPPESVPPAVTAVSSWDEAGRLMFGSLTS